MQRFFALLTLLLVLAPSVQADECDVTSSSVLKDAGDLFAAPFHMDKQAAVTTLGAGILIGSSMIWLDDDLARMAAQPNPPAPYAYARSLSKVASWYGRNGKNAFVVLGAVTGAVALGGVIADDDEVLTTSAIMAESVLFSTGITYVSKIVTGRARPRTGEGPHKFEWFVSPTRKDHVSFPSGHTSSAFALAGAAAGRHPNWYVEVPAYLFAAAAGIQRIDADAHWLSDVLAGGFLGYAIAEFLVDRYECPEGEEPQPTFEPTISFTVNF